MGDPFGVRHRCRHGIYELNIEITERHHHSSPVAYVPKNEDATVSLQSGLDFKFINHNNYPIKFESECADGYVTVWACKEK